MGVCLLLFKQLSLNIQHTESESAGKKTRFDMTIDEIATQGHLGSFILRSVTGRQGAAYGHIILLASSLKFLKK